MEHISLFIPLFALILDTILGEPKNTIHPVCLLGNTAIYLEKKFLKNEQKKQIKFLLGIIATLLCIIIFSLLPSLFFLSIEKFMTNNFSNTIPIIEIFFSSCVLYICIAPNSLTQHINYVTCELQKNNILEARNKLSWIVGRNTNNMNENDIARACIETLSENSIDCYFSSLFWAFVGYCLFSYTGLIFFVSLHRVINTLDAMWGKRNEQYEFFGKFVARFDDVLNFISARISFFIIIFAILITPKTNTKQAIIIGFKYRNVLTSPNSAWAEAPYAGALNLKLAGPVTYGDFYCNYPYIGEGTLLASLQHINTALIIYKNSVIIGTCISIFCFFLLKIIKFTIYYNMIYY